MTDLTTAGTVTPTAIHAPPFFSHQINLNDCYLIKKIPAHREDLNTPDRLRSALWIVEGGLARDAGLFQTLAHFGNRRTGTVHRSHDVGV
jgi:hypothetical protein